MSLREYVRKRKFDRTPEPSPESVEPAAPTQGRFFIQRHDATRLHYDLRLEVGGTLKSWAVPKGPSQVPLSKNLAMQVEDHPLDYGEFEGNIPKGNYGAGSVMLWDKGTFDLLGTGSAEEQIERGDFKFRLHGEKAKGEFAIVRMKTKGRGKGNEWLLIKKRDEFAVEDWDTEEYAWSVKTRRTQEEIARDLAPRETPKPPREPMPATIEPMLAQLAERPPKGRGWTYEIKWDGVRAICFVENGRVRMVSRNNNPYDRQFPELSVLPHHVKGDSAILDGEIVILDENGRSDFGLIQPRIHQSGANEIAHLARSSPVNLFVFDLLWLDGEDLRDRPLSERKELLAEILEPGDRIALSQHFDVDGEQMLEAARQMRLEGIVAKRLTSRYEPRRSDSWLKIKITGRQEFVICGYTHGERDTFSSLVLGVYDGDDLRWAGNVGTGFDERTLRDIHQRLQPLITSDPPFRSKAAMLRDATWVRPELVCECKFTEWTKEGRLRAPVFLGVREDKPARESTREAVRESPFDGKTKEITLEIGGRSLRFGNLDKIWYPREKYTKRDVLRYYDAVAEYVLPHLRDRPLSLKRYPNGIHAEYFFQKNIPETYPDWLQTVPIASEHRGEDIRFVVCADRATLLYLTNLGCIDQNPWMSRAASIGNPDFILIDLDPVECPYSKITEAARLVKEVLDDIGMTGYPKTTGGDGMHVYIPIEPRYTFEQARSFAEIVSQLTLARKPDLFTTPRSVDKRRKNRVYFDYLQIGTGKTIAAPYVLRAYDGAPVATPLEWDEVKPGLTPAQFHIGNAVERFRERGDLFEGVLTQPQKLETALKRIEKMV